MAPKTVCTARQFQQLLDLIKSGGYQLLGPAVQGGAIVYDELQSAQDLPVGWMDEQDPGFYRLRRRTDNAYFGYNLGQHGWKQFLFPPREKIFSVRKKNNTLSFSRETDPPVEKMAFIGVRACEIQALHVLDAVFQNAQDSYEQYLQRKEKLFILAVQCTRSVRTCFCASMKSGPQVTRGFDLCLTEVVEPDDHYFIVEAGTEKGSSFCQRLALAEADQKKSQKAERLVEKNRCEMARHVDHENVHRMLMDSWNCSRWDDAAERCINCANCTMVCPTCFCSEITCSASQDGRHAERRQCWDSCFNLSHSFMHGGPVRKSDRSRYRQWLTHKFGTWWDQFGMSGCVGCGRCITWCPVGIDVTEELRELQTEMEKNHADS